MKYNENSVKLNGKTYNTAEIREYRFNHSVSQKKYGTIKMVCFKNQTIQMTSKVNFLMWYLSTKTNLFNGVYFITIAFAKPEICTTFRKIAKSSLCPFPSFWFPKHNILLYHFMQTSCLQQHTCITQIHTQLA